eukprot:4283484-Pleurochrysis_carterae.AAC.1
MCRSHPSCAHDASLVADARAIHGDGARVRALSSKPRSSLPSSRPVRGSELAVCARVAGG